MKFSQIVLMFAGVLLLTGCAAKKESSKPVETQKKTVVKSVPAKNDSKEVDHTELVTAFAEVYFNQSLDVDYLEEKEVALRKYVGDTALDAMLADIATLKYQVEYYEKDKQVHTNFNSLYVDRNLKSVDIYSNGALYLIDVTFEETSPVYEDGMTYRKQYTFKIENAKIFKFKELP